MELTSLFNLTGDVAVITGAASGLGRAMAEGAAAFGARVALLDRNAEAAESLATQLRSRGHDALAVACDVADEQQVALAMDGVRRELGRLDILFASAGIGDRAPAVELTAEQWDRVITVNLRGLWLSNQSAGRIMIADGVRGRIINMASIAGLVGITSGNANYSASKGGVIALTRCLAAEWAPYGIRVNALAPTHFRTPLVADAIMGNPQLEQYFQGNIPLGRLGETLDIVGPGIFLASGASDMVTGHTLPVDGGHTAV